MDNGDVLDPRSRANVNQVTADRSYSEVTGGSFTCCCVQR